MRTEPLAMPSSWAHIAKPFILHVGEFEQWYDEDARLDIEFSISGSDWVNLWVGGRKRAMMYFAGKWEDARVSDDGKHITLNADNTILLFDPAVSPF